MMTLEKIQDIEVHIIVTRPTIDQTKALIAEVYRLRAVVESMHALVRREDVNRVYNNKNADDDC